MIDRSQWAWMPHAGHLIVGHECRFHLATCVGDYLVSTVGEWWPDESVRESHAAIYGVTLCGKGDARRADYMAKCGFMEIGAGRTYETMVFRAAKSDQDLCCPWKMANGNELDLRGYNDAAEAYHGHLDMCDKWARRQ